MIARQIGQMVRGAVGRTEFCVRAAPEPDARVRHGRARLLWYWIMGARSGVGTQAVQHDRDVITGADHVLDFGPGAGTDGGQIVAAATPTKLKRAPQSLTGRYLAGKDAIAIPTQRRS